MELTSNRSAPGVVEEQEEGVHDRKARGLALSKLARATCPPSGASLFFSSPKDKKYFEDRRMPSSHSNIFNDSRALLNLRVLLADKPKIIPVDRQSRLKPFRMNSAMTFLLGFLLVWTWTTLLVQAQSQEILETHPRKNLGLAAKSAHHHHHHNHKKDEELSKLRDLGQVQSKLQPKDFASFRERRKRHNSRHSKGVEYRQMTSDEERDFQESRKRGAVFLEKSEDYEVEVKEAQNNSICDYKVVPIPDLEGNRIPADLEHVVCNHAGSRCQDMGFYYCLQTYRIIDVYHGHRRSKMKIYAGCVCALFDFPDVQPQSPRLSLDD